MWNDLGAIERIVAVVEFRSWTPLDPDSGGQLAAFATVMTLSASKPLTKSFPDLSDDSLFRQMLLIPSYPFWSSLFAAG